MSMMFTYCKIQILQLVDCIYSRL